MRLRPSIRISVAGIAAVFAAIGPGSAASATIEFATQYQRIPSAPAVSRIHALDIDGDGLQDLVVSGSSLSKSIWCHRGLAGGGYAPVAPLVTFPGVLGPWDFGDINNDGYTDLVAADNSLTAWSLLGNGDGTFQAPRAFLSLYPGDALKLGDLDRDGRLDIVATVQLGPLYTMQGQGDGRFLLTSILSPPAAYPGEVAIGDFDGDSMTDIIAMDRIANVVDLYRGIAGGLVDPPIALPMPGAPRFLSGSDYDQDGRPDALVISFGTTNTISFMYGVPAGASLGRVDLPREGVNSLVAVDQDGDGLLDLLTAERTLAGDQVAILGRTGPRTYAARGDYAAGIQPQCPVSIDADGDGHSDIVVCNPQRSELIVQHGHGATSFGDGEELRTLTMGGVDVGDVNGDHAPDVVTVRIGSASVAGVHLGSGDGTFLPMATTGASYCCGYTAGRLADVDGDGNTDLVGTRVFYSTLDVLRGDGSGHFTPTSSRALGAEPRGSIALAHFDSDLLPDAAVATDRGIGISLGSPDGTFGEPQYLLGAQRVVVAADFNHDGRADLIASNAGMDSEFGSQIHVHLGRGDGTFTTLPTFYAGYKPIAIAVNDANADGTLDVAFANKGDRTIALFLGNGDGTFAPGPLISNVYASAIEMADLDGDGRRDLIASCYDSAYVTVWPGSVNDSFGPPSTFATRSYPGQIRVADLNHDGLSDLVIGRLYGSIVDVLINQTTPVLQVPPHAPEVLAIEGCRWDPPGGTLDVWLSLTTTTAARLQVIDVTGRIVAEERWSPVVTGPQDRRVTAASHPPPGVYWVRLSQAGHSASRRLVLVP